MSAPNKIATTDAASVGILVVCTEESVPAGNPALCPARVGRIKVQLASIA